MRADSEMTKKQKKSLTYILIGVALFAVAVFVQLVTLPVEFDASARALKLLSDTHTLTPGELAGAKSVLGAAALTYVAALVMTIMQLLRLVMLRNARRR